MKRGACVLALALAGCMIGPNYERPATSLPSTFPGAPASGVDIAAASVAPQWWTGFDDPLLDEYVATALSDNLDVAFAVARIQEVDAQLREANAALFPEIDLNALGARSRSSGSLTSPTPIRISNDFRIALSTAFEIDFWGRLRRLVEAAQAQALATHYAKDVVTLSLAGLTAQTYFAIRSLDAQVEATRETLATREDYLDIVRRRVEAGLASDLDYNQALGARADAAAQLKVLAGQRDLAEHLLATLTGKLDLRVPVGTIDRLPVPPMPPPGMPSSLVTRRPDIRLAEENLVAANANIGVAQAALLPRIALTGMFGGESQDLSLVNQSSRIWSIGFAISLPIFTAGRLRAEVEATTAREQQAVINYQRSIQSAFREVADALVNVQQTTSTAADLQQSVDAAANALRLATRRYEVGYSPYLNVLDAQRSLNLSQLALIRNRQNQLSSTVDLMRSLGGGWTDPTPLAQNAR
jgi:multidrug efflux system outer membrane protein